jgi:hypothetical protein
MVMGSLLWMEGDGLAWRAISSSDTRTSTYVEEVFEGRFSTGRGTRLDKPSSSELSFWAAPADNLIKLLTDACKNCFDTF